MSQSKLALFLYLLARDSLPVGEIRRHIKQIHALDDTWSFTDPHLAAWAQQGADALVPAAGLGPPAPPGAAYPPELDAVADALRNDPRWKDRHLRDTLSIEPMRAIHIEARDGTRASLERDEYGSIQVCVLDVDGLAEMIAKSLLRDARALRLLGVSEHDVATRIATLPRSISHHGDTLDTLRETRKDCARLEDTIADLEARLRGATAEANACRAEVAALATQNKQLAEHLNTIKQALKLPDTADPVMVVMHIEGFESALAKREAEAKQWITRWWKLCADLGIPEPIPLEDVFRHVAALKLPQADSGTRGTWTTVKKDELNRLRRVDAEHRLATQRGGHRGRLVNIAEEVLVDGRLVLSRSREVDPQEPSGTWTIVRRDELEQMQRLAAGATEVSEQLDRWVTWARQLAEGTSDEMRAELARRLGEGDDFRRWEGLLRAELQRVFEAAGATPEQIRAWIGAIGTPGFEAAIRHVSDLCVYFMSGAEVRRQAMDFAGVDTLEALRDWCRQAASDRKQLVQVLARDSDRIVRPVPEMTTARLIDNTLPLESVRPIEMRTHRALEDLVRCRLEAALHLWSALRGDESDFDRTRIHVCVADIAAAFGLSLVQPSGREATPRSLHGIIIDCPGSGHGFPPWRDMTLQRATEFWARVLRLPIVRYEDDRYGVLDAGDGLHVEVQLASESGVHIDLAADDVSAEIERLREAGAGLVRRDARGWAVMQAPTGHTFCVVSRTINGSEQ